MVQSTDKELASKAKSEFMKGNYDNCLNLLGKLSVKDDDLKLMHNKAVVEFYKGGTKDVQSFNYALKCIFKKANLRPERLATLDDVDSCVLYYNYSVVLFHTRQYRAALSILSKIFMYIETLDDATAKRIGLLLIECYLSSHQPNMGLKAIKVMEKKFLSRPEDLKRKDGSSTRLQTRIVRCRCRAFLQLNNTAELDPLLQQIPNTSIYHAFMESYRLYLGGSCKEAAEALNRAAAMRRTALSETGEHIATMYFNNVACIHHYSNQPHMAAFYLRRALVENGDALSSSADSATVAVNPHSDTANSTTGDRGDNSASRSAGKNSGRRAAVSSASGSSCDASAWGSSVSGGALHSLGYSRHYELLYNAGLALLHAGCPRRAFDCLIEAIQVYHTNPRLWLRLAECCIMTYRQEKYGQSSDESKGVNLVQSRLGSGLHRKLVLTGSVVQSSCEQVSAAIPNPTMEFAALALRNALLILGEEGEGESPVTLEPANPISADQVQLLRCSVLASAAYVHLCVGEYLVALQWSRQLLRQRLLSLPHQLLANLYASECLLLLGHAEEALTHLSPACLGDVSTEEQRSRPLCWDAASPVSPVGSGAGFPSTVGAARTYLHYNIAAALARLGQLDRAWELLKTMNPSTPGVPAQVVQLALYIQLRLGNSALPFIDVT